MQYESCGSDERLPRLHYDSTVHTLQYTCVIFDLGRERESQITYINAQVQM